jgi:zinc protease
LRVRAGSLDELDRYYFPYVREALSVPESVANRAFRRALFGSHPYATTGDFPEEGRPTEGAANDWLAGVLNPARAVLAIVGDVDPTEAQRLARSAFGGWSGRPPPATPRALSPAGSHAAIVVHRPGATQAELRIGCRLPPATAAESLRDRVLASAVGARLDGVIRKELGVSYGFHARAETLLGGSAVLYLEGSVENAGVAAALQAIRRELGGPGGLSGIDLDMGRWAVARAYNVNLATPERWVSRALAAEKEGWGLESLDAEPRLLASFDGSGLVESLHRCASEGVVSIVGDETVARQALAKAWPK